MHSKHRPHRTQRTAEHIVHTEHKRNTWAATPYVGIGRIHWYSQKYVFDQAQVQRTDLCRSYSKFGRPHTNSNRANPHKPIDGWYPTPTKFSKINREEILGWNKLKTKTPTKVLITEDKWFSGGVEERLQRSRKGGWGATDSPWFRPFSATTRFANFCSRNVINLRA